LRSALLSADSHIFRAGRFCLRQRTWREGGRGPPRERARAGPGGAWRASVHEAEGVSDGAQRVLQGSRGRARPPCPGAADGSESGGAGGWMGSIPRQLRHPIPRPRPTRHAYPQLGQLVLGAPAWCVGGAQGDVSVIAHDPLGAGPAGPVWRGGDRGGHGSRWHARVSERCPLVASLSTARPRAPARAQCVP
jgi:hypothetical protein